MTHPKIPTRPARSRPPRRRCLKCDRPAPGYLCDQCKRSNALIDESFVSRGAVRIGHDD